MPAGGVGSRSPSAFGRATNDASRSNAVQLRLLGHPGPRLSPQDLTSWKDLLSSCASGGSAVVVQRGSREAGDTRRTFTRSVKQFTKCTFLIRAQTAGDGHKRLPVSAGPDPLVPVSKMVHSF